ncbi:hypothetical protein CR513_49614, partial [Mucuna pruriens]
MKIRLLFFLLFYQAHMNTFKDAILFGRDQTITFDEVQTSIRSKEFQKMQEVKTENKAKGLNVMRDKLEKKKFKSKKHRSKSRYESQRTSMKEEIRIQETSRIRNDYYESLNFIEGGVVLLGNNKPCKEQGMGSILLKMFNGQETLLLGYTTQIEHDIMKISNNILETKEMTYILNGSTVIAKAVIASQNQHDKTKLWHMRLD